MYHIQFENFRYFHSSPLLEIRPITLLVGENSAGKTSFLAGVRYLLESLSRGARNSFNRDPYFLGGFEQIAHFRGGRGGRAKSFSLSLEVPFTLKQTQQTSTSPQSDIALHKFSFVKGYPQPELDSYIFRAVGIEARLVLSSEMPQVIVQYIGKPDSASAVVLKQAPPSSAVRANSSYIQYISDELMFFGKIKMEKISAKNKSDKSEFSSESLQNFWKVFRNSVRPISQEVFASAPVRTQPLRTYTPSEIVASSEGSHVPLELARLKQKSIPEWRTTKQKLEDFGKKSGLFTDIEIRQLGKSDIDPFQILVKVNGPAMNLADVGYGVSQALPIVYQMQNSSRYKTFLLQQPEVHLHPKAQAEFGTLLTQLALKRPSPTVIVETHSDYIIDRVRIEVMNGSMSHDAVTILWFTRGPNGATATNIYLNKSGEIDSPPEGFRDFFIEEHAKLLGL